MKYTDTFDLLKWKLRAGKSDQDKFSAAIII